MKMFALITLAIFAPVATLAQTFEEKLPECIEKADILLSASGIIRSTAETVQGSANAADVASISLSVERKMLFDELLDGIDKNNLSRGSIRNKRDSIEDFLNRKKTLIIDMVNEHWSNESEYVSKAKFIAACAINFGGEVEYQADQIERLAALNAQVVSKNRQLNDRITELSDKLKANEKELARLSSTMDVLSSELWDKSREIVLIKNQLDNTTELSSFYKRLAAKSSGMELIEYVLSIPRKERMLALRDTNLGGELEQYQGQIQNCLTFLQRMDSLSDACRAALALKLS